MSSILLALCAAVGVHLLFGSLDRRHRVASTPSGAATVSALARHAQRRLTGWMLEAGLESVSPLQFAVVVLGLAATVFCLTAPVFGVGLPAMVMAVTAGMVPIAMWRSRHRAARRAAQESWPALIEELRVLTGAAGRPIPQALLQVGLRGPIELRPAFEAAQREWALSTDFERTVAVLKRRLADPAADATCETLLVAHAIGGDIDLRLQALAEDRRADVRDRRESDAKQAGARFARWFVIIVPAGMGLAGLSVGDGRSAYQNLTGQVLVAGAISMIVACWWWAGRIMQVPDEDRVFAE